MARPMWPDDAVCRFAVRGTYKQSAAWRYAANLSGLKIPVFLALAADDYVRRLDRRIARQERKERKG